MVAINHGSLTIPLLGDHNENIQNSCTVGFHRDEVVVVVPSESQDHVIIPEESLANQRRRGHFSRNSIQKKSLVARAEYSAKTNTWNFLYNLMIGLFMWPKLSWDAMKKNSNLTILASKQGVCAGLCTIPCVVKIPEPFTEVSTIALWAVITTGVLYEENIGLSINKGCNRVLGTLAAGCLGFGLNQIGLRLGPAHPYFVVLCVVMGSFIFRFLKGIPRLKEQWGYAFTVATIAFHIFIICGYLYPERWTLPMLRLSVILLGVGIASIFNIAIRPIYAGDTLHKLMAKKFETAASVFERCVELYLKDTKLDHVLDILSERCEDNKTHQNYPEIMVLDSDIDKLVSVVEFLRQSMMSDTEMEKLLSAVLWEPPHGNFFMGYPWHLYDDIVDCLRYALYDVIALDLCLRPNIQAPKHLRDIFAQEMATIAIECATILHILGDSMKNMKKFSSENILTRAEEAAVELQSKIHQNMEIVLGSTTEFEHLLLGTPQNSQPSIHQPILNQDDLISQPSIHHPILDQDNLISENEAGTNKSWKNSFLHRKSNLGPHWDDTLERVSALSLVKFASLLIEVVSKMRFLVDCVEDFSEQAKFQACSN